ncbi:MULTISPECIES: ComEC/Rec2 family competence protein [unclassified Micromonospora]|uniref:ComEC/Rec2 family competence protein n=1 Tax=Micromonospora TaxID=1873 RepID=UPI0011844576|nr:MULTISPECIES: MBL fold metallo-hydrolase [unclassified Micromonospora]
MPEVRRGGETPMTWSLEIHHIDVKASGDSTLIVARDDGVGHAHGATIRTCLIDGGRQKSGPIVDSYLTNNVNGLGTGFGERQLDVIAVTHYDADHLFGITYLLNRGPLATPMIYDDTYIYDQGETSADDDQYLRYVQAIARRPGRVRVTRNVASDPQPVNKQRGVHQVVPGPVANVRTPPAMFGGGVVVPGNPAIPAPAPLAVPAGAVIAAGTLAHWWHPYWLVGREILWTDEAGEPITELRPGVPPTVTCIAANRYVRDAAGTARFRAGAALTGTEQLKNEKSLAFLVQFGTFRYYIGGDIEHVQERTIGRYLNPNDTVGGRVHVVKASHHGADTASRPAFIDRMRPETVIISCGTKNQYGHPSAGTIDTLNGIRPAMPGGPPVRKIPHYLTGYQDVNPPASLSGILGQTAGEPGPPLVARGHVLLEVSAVQSQYDASGLRSAALTATVTEIANATGAAPLPAGLLDDMNDVMIQAGSLVDAIGAVIGSVFAAPPGLGTAAAAAPAIAAGTAVVAGGVAAVVPAVYAAATAAAAPPAAAAVAAAAAGIASFLGTAPAGAVPAAVGQAVHDAALLAGVAAAPAVAAGNNAIVAVTAAVPATGRFTVTYWDRGLHPPMNRTVTAF